VRAPVGTGPEGVIFGDKLCEDIGTCAMDPCIGAKFGCAGSDWPYGITLPCVMDPCTGTQPDGLPLGGIAYVCTGALFGGETAEDVENIAGC